MHKTWQNYWGHLSTALAWKEVVYSERSTVASVTYKANVEELQLVFPTIQCISINVRSCVFTGSAWPLIFIQLSSTPTNHSSLCNCGSRYVKSHWLHSAVSPGKCNITFLFPSAAAAAADGGRLQINTDILQWRVRLPVPDLYT